jgi:hypothetical protein
MRTYPPGLRGGERMRTYPPGLRGGERMRTYPPGLRGGERILQACAEASGCERILQACAEASGCERILQACAEANVSSGLARRRAGMPRKIGQHFPLRSTPATVSRNGPGDVPRKIGQHFPLRSGVNCDGLEALVTKRVVTKRVVTKRVRHETGPLRNRSSGHETGRRPSYGGPVRGVLGSPFPGLSRSPPA